MKTQEIITVLEQFAPPSLQENYDNAGWITGNPSQECTGVLFCLDSTEAVLEEAIQKNCNLIIAHHPIVFSGLKKINGKNYIERVIIKAIKNDLAIYAAHTNLDNVRKGVNAKICEKLGIKNPIILDPKKQQLKYLQTFVPHADKEKVTASLFAAGAGNIGNYDQCSFYTEGTGSFRGNDDSQPVIGTKGQRHFEPETKVEVIFPAYAEGNVLKALMTSHPYEEVAYQVFALENSWQEVGSGMIGELETPVDAMDFLHLLKTKLGAEGIRYTAIHKEKVQKIAVCGGAGSFLLQAAIKKGADVFVTADFKYHQFFDADEQIIIADVGHFESEQNTIQLFYDILKEKFGNFALHLTHVNTNPVKYL